MNDYNVASYKQFFPQSLINARQQILYAIDCKHFIHSGSAILSYATLLQSAQIRQPTIIKADNNCKKLIINTDASVYINCGV